MVFDAHLGDTWLASWLLMQAGETAYYHFSANAHSTQSGLANALLMLESMLWAKSQGYRHYHLGGGRSNDADDSLLKFKSAFDAKLPALFGYNRIINSDIFKRLLATLPSEAREDPFFPPYRKGRTL